VPRTAGAAFPSLEHVMQCKSLLLAIALALSVTMAAAHEYKVGALKIDHPWARATPKGVTIGGGYMKITNTGSEPDRLIGGSATFAGRFEVHQMMMNGGIMQMRPLAEGLEIKPGETVELRPGSFHVMFVDLKQPLAQGQKLGGSLQFQKAGKVDVEFAVESIGGTPAGDQHMSH
jgi:copper(I)-binding protein